MKKLFIVLAFVFAVFASQAQYLNTDEETNFSFVAPDSAASTANPVLFPIADVQTYDYDTNDTLTMYVNQFYTFLTLDTIEGSFYIDATVNSQVTGGALIYFELPADGTNRKVYFNTGFATDSVTVTASTTARKLAIYNGSSFYLID